MTYGTGIATESSLTRALHIASTKSPSKGTSSALSRVIVSTLTCSPINDLIVSLSSSSNPGMNRPSTTALAEPGITLALYPASNMVGLAVFCNVAPIMVAAKPISLNRGRRSSSLYGLFVSSAIRLKNAFTVLL